jgi:hypothetical protein
MIRTILLVSLIVMALVITQQQVKGVFHVTQQDVDTKFWGIFYP